MRPMSLSTLGQCHLPCLALATLATRLLQGAMAQSVSPASPHQLARLNDPNVVISNDNGTTHVYSALTGDEIPQGYATDGCGSGFSLPAVLWIVFSFSLGVPLLLAGFRGRRVTSGAVIGLSAALALWSVFVNTLDNIGISDITLTVIVLALFAFGFLFGIMDMSLMAGVLQLGIQGGLAIGIRLVLLRNLLLLANPDVFFVNWLLIAFFGLAGAILVIWRQRVGLLAGSASVGSFLCALGIDLTANQQSGMSRGLRYLIDRNRYHVVDTTSNGYFPPTTTFVIIALSIALTPVFAYAQHTMFKGPFLPVRDEDIESLCGDEFPEKERKMSDAEADPPETPVSATSLLNRPSRPEARRQVVPATKGDSLTSQLHIDTYLDT